MYFEQTLFVAILVLCCGYAALAGGRTGKAAASLFLIAATLSYFAAYLNPTWQTTSTALMWVDIACLLGLCVLAFGSNRHWPIWALGFQIVAISTHLGTIWLPDFVPKAYQLLLSFWSIPILAVMVAGTAIDRQFETFNSTQQS